jgi:hypothetical protein
MVTAPSGPQSRRAFVITTSGSVAAIIVSGVIMAGGSFGDVNYADAPDMLGQSICRVGDCDGDKASDLIVEDRSSGSIWLLSGRTHTVLARSKLDRGTQALDAQSHGGIISLAGDADGDNVGDVLSWVVERPAPLKLTLRSGATLKELWSVTDIKGAVNAPNAGADLDGDGVPDVLVPSLSDGQVMVVVLSGKDGCQITSYPETGSVADGSDLVTCYTFESGSKGHFSRGVAVDIKSRDRRVLHVGHLTPDKLGSAFTEQSEISVKAAIIVNCAGFGPLAVIDASRHDVLDESTHITMASYGSEAKTIVLEGPRLADFEELAVAECGDVDSDGAVDLGLCYRGVYGEVVIYSGKTFTVIRRHGEETACCLGSGSCRFGHVLSRLGDVDCDGVEDYAIGSAGMVNAPNPGAVCLYSGKTGALLFAVSKQILK